MPKHKRHSDDFEKLSRKIRKLERELQRVRSDNDGGQLDINSIGDESETPINESIFGDIELSQMSDNTGNKDAIANEEPATEADIVEPAPPADAAVETQEDAGLDIAALEILGADPAAVVEYGKNIHKELASRLEHIVTMGLTKEVRKELSEKYLVPANCTKIGAPLMNAEVKAAITDIIIKRDKGIEGRQKQLACAIAGLAMVVNKELDSKEKDSERLKQLMDVCRILCDVQHAESVTRRNFAIFSIKKDLKDHMVNTKIDKYLFGENLAEALKTAKAVTKSGTDLKVKSQARPVKPSSATSNLNWKAPALARRQQGPLRSREPAQPLAAGAPPRYNRAPTHAHSSKPSQHPSKQIRRR